MGPDGPDAFGSQKPLIKCDHDTPQVNFTEEMPDHEQYC